MGTHQPLECPGTALPEERDGTSSPQDETESFQVDGKEGEKQVSMETGEPVSGIAIQDWGSHDEVEGRILKTLGTHQPLECPVTALPEERDGTVTSSPQEETKSLHLDGKVTPSD